MKNMKENVIAGVVAATLTGGFIGAHAVIDSIVPEPAYVQESTDYRVTDEESHMKMCHSDHVAPSDRASCIMSARVSWN